LREPLGTWQVVGGVFVLLGIYLARATGLRHRIVQEKTT